MTGAMDRRERYKDDEEAFRVAFEGLQRGIWTALPGQIVSVNLGAMTCVVQPTIQARQQYPDGSFKYVNLPSLLDVPIVFPSGGGHTLTLPLAEGDEVLVVFSARCIDGWWANGGIQMPLETRLHDLSDGFCIPGVFSQPRVIGGVSGTTAQLRSNDGSTFIEVDGNNQIVNISAPVQVNINSPVVNIAGVLAVQNENNQANPCAINGSVRATGDIIAGSGSQNISALHHTHSDPQGGNTGPPQ